VLPHARTVVCTPAHRSTEDDVVANIAYAASENRLQIKGASGKARQRKGNSLLLENKLQQGPGHRRYEKFVLHEKRNDLVLSGEPNKYKTNNETMSSAHITPRFGTTSYQKKKGLVLHAAHLASYKNINSDDSSTSSPSYHSSTLLLLRSLGFCNGTLTAIMQ